MTVSSQHLLVRATVHTELHINRCDTLLSPVTREHSKSHYTMRNKTKCVFVLLCVMNDHPLHQFNLLLPSHPAARLTVLSQIFMSRTSVGVAERSCPSLMFLVSMVTECCCCCACLRLVSSNDSICS